LWHRVEKARLLMVEFSNIHTESEMVGQEAGLLRTEESRYRAGTKVASQRGIGENRT
jgi:hypothetical protein